ncbi:MAG: nitroreductase [Cardiobacteriaceae bacterium]|nr:nitroreductase [Cardiobacteriaceae bacterium]
MNATLETLLHRTSVKPQFLTDPAPEATELTQILQVATRVSDHGNLHPWRLDVFRKAAQEKLAEVLLSIWQKNNPDADAELTLRKTRFVCAAPLMIMVSSRIQTQTQIPPIEQLLSGAAVCQNMLLAATALGYSACWLTTWAAHHAEVKAHLQVREEDEILGFIFLGTAQQKGVERERPTLDEIVVWHD